MYYIFAVNLDVFIWICKFKYIFVDIMMLHLVFWFKN